MSIRIKLPVIIGPTASGKTRLAAMCAHILQAEIISADSRQVYRGMDIGTGKDYEDYIVENVIIPYHLIDIVNAGYAYNLYEYTRDFGLAFSEISTRGVQPIVCGGTGLYVESIVKQYSLHEVPQDEEYRKLCEQRSFDELVMELSSYKTLHNTSDIDTKKRLIRALEIARYEHQFGVQKQERVLPYEPIVIGVDVTRETRRSRIEQRLQVRLQQGMTHEVEKLLAQGVSAEQLIYYGLEYKYITLYVTGQISEQQMVDDLYIAICQFAKRQMTWFRGMERRGICIHWINGEVSMNERVEQVMKILKHKK